MANLGEVDESKLRAELKRREEQRNVGKCDYCGKPVGTGKPCKFPERHRGETT